MPLIRKNVQNAARYVPGEQPNLRKVFIPRSAFYLVALLFLSMFTACERSDPRLQPTIDSLHWGGGTADDRRVRDLLVAALQKATNASLATPNLVAATAALPIGEQKNGLLRFDWIGASPVADSVRVLFSDGTTADIPFDPVYIRNNESESSHSLIYQAIVFAQRDQPVAWGKVIADHDAKAVLLKDSKVVSNELAIIFRTPAPRAPETQSDTSKLIGTVDPDGHTWMYLLSADVKAGHIFSLSDVYRAEFIDQTGLPHGHDSFLDTTGPAAFIAHPFQKDCSANEPLDSSMFTLSATQPASGQ